MVTFTTDEWILLISFSIIYLAFLAYDLFKRGERYGTFAYLLALIPANYLWYLATKDSRWIEFGAMGAMMVLSVLWIACIIRDVAIKNRDTGFKDADDIALVLIISLIVQFILNAVLPALPGNEAMQIGTTKFLSYFYVPDFIVSSANPTASSIITAYKVAATVLVILIIIPIILDLRGEKVNIIAVIIITAVFALPFAFLAFLWAPFALGAMLFLILVLFFLFLLAITRGLSGSSPVLETAAIKRTPKDPESGARIEKIGKIIKLTNRITMKQIAQNLGMSIEDISNSIIDIVKPLAIMVEKNMLVFTPSSNINELLNQLEDLYLQSKGKTTP